MTKLQLASLHTTFRRLGALSGGIFTRADYDLVLLNLGRVRAGPDGSISSKNIPDQRGFERVMGYLEEQTAKWAPDTPNHWRKIADRHGRLLTTRQEWIIHNLYGQMLAAGATYTLESIVRQHSRGRTDRVSDIAPREAIDVIEHIKNVVERRKVNH